jgi:hypothetical protein
MRVMMAEAAPRPNDRVPADCIATAVHQAHAHIVSNLTAAVAGRKCIDGRYPPDTGQLARPGADFGYVEVLLALNTRKRLGLTPRQCFDLVYAYATRDGGGFFLHTDIHADPPEDDGTRDVVHATIGCAHCANAADPGLAPAYDLDPEEMTTLIRYAKDRHRRGDRVDLVCLSGAHTEQGVILVDSDHSSVNATDRAGTSRYFIYDQQRDDAYLFQWVYWLQSRHGLGLPLEAVRQMAARQTAATLHLQAAGKPMLRVTLDAAGQPAPPRFVEFIP